jgi:hypothetical protein
MIHAHTCNWRCQQSFLICIAISTGHRQDYKISETGYIFSFSQKMHYPRVMYTLCSYAKFYSKISNTLFLLREALILYIVATKVQIFLVDFYFDCVLNFLCSKFVDCATMICGVFLSVLSPYRSLEIIFHLYIIYELNLLKFQRL